MARIRTIKPEFFTSLSIADLSPLTRLTFIGIWTHVDDEGRCIDDARLIKAAVSPLERTVSAIEADLVALADQGRLIRYEGDGKRLIQVANWHEHQYINRPRPSKFPGTDGVNAHGGITEHSRTAHARKGKERKGTGKGTESDVADKSDDAARSTELALVNNSRDDVNRICEHLAGRIEQNGAKRPRITKAWRDAARLMLDADGRPEAEIYQAIDWCQADGFWRANILSMPKLRDKYDQLKLQAARPVRQSKQQETDALFERAAQRLGVTGGGIL